MELIETLKGKRIYFDTNIFIYIIEGSIQYQKIIDKLTKSILQKDFEPHTSYITLTEVLPPLVKRGDKDTISGTVEFICNNSFFHLSIIDEEICLQAGFLRGELGIKTPDALHVATAINQGCNIFLTNDAGIHVPKNMKRILLYEFCDE
ncbi:MAG: PIN domain-containing protein [Pseudomonadota bacterium]